MCAEFLKFIEKKRKSRFLLNFKFFDSVDYEKLLSKVRILNLFTKKIIYLIKNKGMKR